MQRILVSGISGSGKTTLATKLAGLLGLPRYELDALHHGPGWVKRTEFESDVAQFAATPEWVTEDQYQSLVGELLWPRADLLIWLDLPRPTIMRRVVVRSVSRAATRQELWNGNRESIRDWADPGHPMRWAWSQHAARRQTIEERVEAYPHLKVVRLRTAAEVDALLDRIRG